MIEVAGICPRLMALCRYLTVAAAEPSTIAPGMPWRTGIGD